MQKPTLTAVSRVISFPIRSTSTGRHAGNSALRLSPNVDTRRPMQEIAHSLTSWNRSSMIHGKKCPRKIKTIQDCLSFFVTLLYGKLFITNYI